MRGDTMKVTYEKISAKYDIPIKIYEPEGEVTGVCAAAHGFGGDMESTAISLYAKRLTEDGCAVVTFCFAGHGVSRADEHFCVSNCKLDLLRIFEYACKRFANVRYKAVFGTSFGGYITLLSLDELAEDIIIVLRSPAVNMAETFKNKLLDIPFDTYEKNGAVMGFERKLYVSPDFYRDLKTYDVSQKSFGKNMLVLHGSLDDLVTQEHINAFKAANPMAVIHKYVGADHRLRDKNCGYLGADEVAGYILSKAQKRTGGTKP